VSETGNVSTYFEPDPSHASDPSDVVAGCMECEADAVLFDERALPTAFFDLSSGVAGELLHKLSVYRIRLAAVVPDPSIHSERFREFARESNAGRQFRFFPTREAAVAWLESGS